MILFGKSCSKLRTVRDNFVQQVQSNVLILPQSSSESHKCISCDQMNQQQQEELRDGNGMCFIKFKMTHFKYFYLSFVLQMINTIT